MNTSETFRSGFTERLTALMNERGAALLARRIGVSATANPSRGLARFATPHRLVSPTKSIAVCSTGYTHENYRGFLPCFADACRSKSSRTAVSSHSTRSPRDWKCNANLKRSSAAVSSQENPKAISLLTRCCSAGSLDISCVDFQALSEIKIPTVGGPYFVEISSTNLIHSAAEKGAVGRLATQAPSPLSDSTSRAIRVWQLNCGGSPNQYGSMKTPPIAYQRLFEIRRSSLLVIPAIWAPSLPTEN